MKKRNIALVIIFSFITLGIYDLFWLASTRKEMVDRGAKIPKLAWLFAPLLGFIVVALLQFAIRFALSSTAFSSGTEGGNAVINVLSLIISVIALLAFIPVTIYWFYRYCQGVEHVTRGRTELGLSFGMWLVSVVIGIFFIWPGIIQDGFNKVVDGDSTPQPPYPNSNPTAGSYPQAPLPPNTLAPPKPPTPNA